MSIYRFVCCAIPLLFLLSTASVQSASGPDAFGYYLQSNTDPGGPPLEWIDISTLGTPVPGLTDDNAAAPINLPSPFRYYWTEASQITIGSNGWVSFEPISNFTSCFPYLPQFGGVDDGFLAPLMTDLTFDGAGNPGSVRTYHDVAASLFIISYINVPRWTASAPGFYGSNTFQVVLDYTDHSIRFNYQNADHPGFQPGCLRLVSGIESPRGVFGLPAFGGVPPTEPTTLRFSHTLVPLTSYIDVFPSAALNADSAAVIVEAGTSLPLGIVVENSGTDPTTGTIDVNAQVLQGAFPTVLYEQSAAIPVLAANQPVPVSFAPDYVVVPGTQAFRAIVEWAGGDMTVGNNGLASEVFGLVPGATDQRVAYTDAITSNGSVSQGGVSGTFSFGAAIFMDLPNSEYEVKRLGAFIATASNSDTYALELRDNDGQGGSPGTSLALIEVAAGSVVSGLWSDLELPQPVPVDDDGFYLVWYQRSNTITLGTPQILDPQLLQLSLPPVPEPESISRRSFELVANNFYPYRQNQTAELMLRVTVNDARVFRDGFE